MKGKKIVSIIAALLVLLAAGIWLFVSMSGRSGDYKEATMALQEGNTDRAYVLFKGLGGYRDSEEQLADLDRKDPALKYRTLVKGDLVEFGMYEQDNNISNGAEPIEWIVLDKIDNEVLLLSVDCLDAAVYNSVPFEPVTWETSEIRNRLNDVFYSDAFSAEEKTYVALVEHVNPDQSVLETEGGNDTRDYVYLLGEKEAGIYMGDEMTRDYLGKATATHYAVSQGAHTDEQGLAEWWLRSPGAYEYTAQFVETNGTPYIAGAYVDIVYAVRPAIWIDAGACGDER